MKTIKSFIDHVSNDKLTSSDVAILYAVLAVIIVLSMHFFKLF